MCQTAVYASGQWCPGPLQRCAVATPVLNLFCKTLVIVFPVSLRGNELWSLSTASLEPPCAGEAQSSAMACCGAAAVVSGPTMKWADDYYPVEHPVAQTISIVSL